MVDSTNINPSIPIDSFMDDNITSYFGRELENWNMDSFILAVIMFSFCIIGIFGNVVSVIIFSKRSMRSSINVLLSGLSFIDLLVLIFALPVFVLPSFTEAVPNQVLDPLYPWIIFVMYPLSSVCQTSSVWTFVLINVERYLAVCQPFRVRKLFTMRRTRVMLACVVAMAICYNFVRLWEFQEDTRYGLKQLLRNNKYYYHIYYTTLYQLTHFCGPFLTMLALNICILRRINEAKKMRETFTKRAALQHRTTRMIVVVTSIFGLCNTLPFVLNIWEAFEPNDFWDDVKKPALLVTDFSNCLVILNSSSTFLVYIIYCTSYRKLFLMMFRIIKRELPSSEHHVTDFGQSEYPMRQHTQLRAILTPEGETYKYGSVLERKQSNLKRLSSRTPVDACSNQSEV